MKQSETDTFFALLTARRELQAMGMHDLARDVERVSSQLRMPREERIARRVVAKITRSE